MMRDVVPSRIACAIVCAFVLSFLRAVRGDMNEAILPR